MTDTDMELDDLLIELSMSTSADRADRLDELVRRYPQHARALTAFALEEAYREVDGNAESTAEAIPVAETDPVVLAAMSKFQNRLHELKREQQGAANPFENASTKQMRDLAYALHANLPFVMKLRDRNIQPSTITAGMCKLMARGLGVEPGAVEAHLAGSPVVQRNMYASSERKPEAQQRQQSLEEAMDSCGLSEQQKQFLRGV